MRDKAKQLTQPKVNGTWVQTERSAHEAWALLTLEKPRAGSLLHLMVANMDHRGALIASHATLAALAKTSVSTLKRALAELIAGQWIQTVRLGSERGGALAYVVNSRVAWAGKRENLRFALFDARVLVSSLDQESLEGPVLRQIPAMLPGELQLPSGKGEPPPGQPLIPGMEPDLPQLNRDPNTVDMFDEG